jgi:Uma2 family endonuclease
VPLVVEVLSKSTKKFDLTGKLEKYAAVGIRTYWIIDPLAERVTLARYSLGSDGAYRMVQRTAERVTVDDPWKITLDLPAWTRKRDQLSRVSRRH